MTGKITTGCRTVFSQLLSPLPGLTQPTAKEMAKCNLTTKERAIVTKGFNVPRISIVVFGLILVMTTEARETIADDIRCSSAIKDLSSISVIKKDQTIPVRLVTFDKQCAENECKFIAIHSPTRKEIAHFQLNVGHYKICDQVKFVASEERKKECATKYKVYNRYISIFDNSPEVEYTTLIFQTILSRGNKQQDVL